MKAFVCCATTLTLCAISVSASQTYSLVQGIDKFFGSTTAWHLLETNGFVVADPSYKQIFESYLDNSLPPFITTDSAWETYQILLAAGKKQLEPANQPKADFFSTAIQGKVPADAPLSGLDFLVASPELRSAAATRELIQLSGGSAEEVVKNLNFSLPVASLSGHALHVLATLQKPVAGQPAPAFRSEAWEEEQLWAQLGAWIEPSFPGKPHTGFSEGYAPTEDASKIGAVAPYPDFFSGLAELCRETASAMEKAGMDEAFDTRAVAQKLLEGVFILQSLTTDTADEMARKSNVRIQFDQFVGRYMEAEHAGGGENSLAAQEMLKSFEAVARRCLGGGTPSGEDQKILRGFYDERMTPPRLLRDFAATCDKLAELAGKQSAGTPFTEDDGKWIAGYGLTLARYHFFPDPSGEGTEGDRPVLNRIGTNSADGSVLLAGLGRPEALYIILPADGRLHLFRGAVLSYREIVRPVSKETEVSPTPAGNTSPPGFTAGFRAEKSASDILETLATDAGGGEGYRDIQEALEALQSRVTDTDLPALIRALALPDTAWPGNTVSSGLAAAIAKLNWATSQRELLSLIDKDDGVHAGAVAAVLSQRPDWLDGAFLRADFDGTSARSRRVRVFLLGLLRPTDETRGALLQALRDDAPGVRWQAVLAVGNVSWDARQKTGPLLERLSDTNEWVSGVAARGLGKIGAAEVAPVLFSNLQQRLARPAPNAGALREQRAAVLDYVLGIIGAQSSPFDPDNLLGRAQTGRMRRVGADARREQFSASAALIESLGELHYEPATDTILGLLGGPNASAAVKALKKLAPHKLAERLVSIAADKNAQPQARDDALVFLGDSAAGGPMPGLIPLLDDRTPVPAGQMGPGRDWRICDRAASTLATLMGRTAEIQPGTSVEQRDELIEQIRQWLKSAY